MQINNIKERTAKYLLAVFQAGYTILAGKLGAMEKCQ